VLLHEKPEHPPRCYSIPPSLIGNLNANRPPQSLDYLIMSEQILDRSGKLIGRVHSMSEGRKEYHDPRGMVVARVQNGNTYDYTGRLIGKGDLGMYALAQGR